MYILEKLQLTNILSHTNSTFEFRQGKAILIIGRNLDKEGAKGNGAGKSSLNEGISIAITGGSIRDVKARELVRRGEEVGVVKLVLFNTMYQCYLEIERTLYSKESKSSECKIYENGVLVESCPDINSYNKFILTALGISKEDFFNFFLITKEYYTPFLTVGDTKKKEIINRFSGADVVDKTTPLVDRDLQSIEEMVKTKSSSLSSLEGQILANTKSLEEERLAISNEKIESEIKLIEDKNSNIEDSISFLKDANVQLGQKILDLEQQLSIKRTEKESLVITDNKLSIDKCKDEMSKILEEIQVLENKKLSVSDTIKQKVGEIRETETLANSSIKEVQANKLQTVKEVEDLKNKLQGAITCPKCSHEFTLRYKDFNVTVAHIEVAKLQNIVSDYESEIKSYEEIIVDLGKEKEDVNAQILKDRQGVELLITEQKQLLAPLKQKEVDLIKESDAIFKQQRDISGEIQSIELEVQRFENKIKGNLQTIQLEELSIQNNLLLIKKLKEVDNRKVLDLEEKISVLEKNVESTQLELNELFLKKQKVEAWYINFKNFKSHLANQSIKNISDYTNLYLKGIQSNITINIEGYRMMSNKKLKEEIVTTVYKDGFEEGSYGSFSAGERGRIEICCILAMQELINLNSPSGGLDLLSCDEILDSVDDLGLELILNSLQNLRKTIMIVSQNQINSLAESTVIIEKLNKNSTIC